MALATPDWRLCRTVIFIWFNFEQFSLILSQFQYRFEAHADDNGRTDIWLSCLDYLKNHFRALLVGNGALNYHNVGGADYAFYQVSVHNLYLDNLLAFGVIGTVLLVRIYSFFYQKCRRMTFKKTDLIAWMPFLTLSVYYITSGSFRYFKTWMYYIIVIYFIFATKKEEVEEIDS